MKISVRALAALLLISMLLCALPTNIFAHDESLHDHGTLVSDHDGHDHGDTDGVDSDFHSHVNWQSGSVSNGAPTSTTENKITLLNGTGIPGDVNADGTVNNKDAVALLRFLKSEKTAVDSDALDVNGDGAINTDDVTLLFRYVSGWLGVAVGYGSAWAEKCRHDLKNVPATAATCYENGNVERILDTLKKEEVTAAFFLLDNIILKNTDLVTRMAEEGHLVCNHTKNHKNLCDQSYDNIKEDIFALERIYSEATGKEMDKYFRFPKGVYSESALEIVESLGYKTVFWSFAYDDWDNGRQPNREKAINKILSNTHNGAIILLHPTSEVNADIMPTLISEWRSMGYEFGSLNDL